MKELISPDVISIWIVVNSVSPMWSVWVMWVGMRFKNWSNGKRKSSDERVSIYKKWMVKKSRDCKIKKKERRKENGAWIEYKEKILLYIYITKCLSLFVVGVSSVGMSRVVESETLVLNPVSFFFCYRPLMAITCTWRSLSSSIQ